MFECERKKATKGSKNLFFKENSYNIDFVDFTKCFLKTFF